MQIRKLILGSMMTNAYILGESNVALVDPGSNAKGIYDYLKKENLTLEAILVTHGHFDHIGALCELKKLSGAKVYMHKSDMCMMGDMEKSLGFMMNVAPEVCEVDVVLYGGEEIHFGDDFVKVLHTPGHSRGSVSYIGDGFVCCGDLIFKESIGRYDYGNFSDEMDSIDRLLSLLDMETVILPGHGEETTVCHERENNPYIR